MTSVIDRQNATVSNAKATETSEIALDGYGLTLEDVRNVATQPGKVGLSISPASVIRMVASQESKDRIVESGIPIYGVTTGFGDSSGRQISPDKAIALQRNLLRFLRVGQGPIAPDEVIRATMLIRANSAARGNSGISQEPIQLILTLLENDLLPSIPERGSVGASGDLAPLSYLAAALTGEGTLRHQGQELPAASAIRSTGLKPVSLVAKEGLALVNGTSFMAGYATLALAEATELAWAAELCTALATEIRRSSRDQFHAFPHEHKPHPGQVASAANIYQMLSDSPSVVSDTDLVGPGSGEGREYIELERKIQDPYSIRCAPHVVGVLRDTVAWADPWLSNEINSSNDNPLFDADTDTVHYSGNFYGGHVAQATQAISSAVASLADLLDRQLALMVDEKFSLGLTPNLIAPTEPEDFEAGLHHGFKGAQIAASALTAEALHLTMPMSSFSRSTEAHNQDKVSMGTIAARHSYTVVQLASQVTAIHLLALCQAADLTGTDKLGSTTRTAQAYIRKHVAFLAEDRPMDSEIDAIATLLRSGEIRRNVLRQA
ncbi:MAG: aromatic amino acid lyase [Amycolatopsis sp.]|jgi:phenylalanine ammonia-lyase|uniref:HAL/PAL/TAL family ammonia-lyase n=1 Tax=Amycolatopsis sp. TaxID=37632 RepID=UPI00262C2F8C|nr:aromatic amino acid ammonia-lyase [Amycolatopsis sp.]MCU1681454.1 aromatic amino acid lyase [Amycolatopsis sp.]